MSARIEDLDGDGIKEIIDDYVPCGSPLKGPFIYKWNGKSYLFAERAKRLNFMMKLYLLLDSKSILPL